MKLKIQLRRNIRIGLLLVGKVDIKPHRLTAHIGRATVARLHDRRPAARADRKRLRRLGRAVIQGPRGNFRRQCASVLIVMGDFQNFLGLCQRLLIARFARGFKPFAGLCRRWYLRRTEKNNRIVHAQGLHPYLGIGGLRQNPHPAGLVAVHVIVVKHRYRAEGYFFATALAGTKVERVDTFRHNAYRLRFR